MRVAALVLVVAAAAACRRGSLQDDAGGAGPIGVDGGGGTTVAGGGAGGSGGGLGWIDGGPAGMDTALPGPDANCGVVTVASNYIAPQILLLIDQAIGDRTRWNQMLMSVRGMIAGNGERIDWGVYASPEPGPACGAETVTGTIDLPVTAKNYEAALAAVGSVWLGGSGRPTAAAIRVTTAYAQTLPLGVPRYLMLVTDGAPSCAGSIGGLRTDATQAQEDALDAISVAIDNRIPTMVVAPEALADSEVEAVNQLAVAGGYPTAGPRIRYYTESGLTAFSNQSSSTCTFRLSVPPPDPNLVAVTFDSASVPRDKAHVDGWDYTDATHEAITFNGSWCERVFESRKFEVNVYYGCPSPTPR